MREFDDPIEATGQPNGLDSAGAGRCGAGEQNALPAPVDLRHLRRYTLGDTALEREVLCLFINQLPETLSALGAARTDKDWKNAAHTLKGSGRAVGAWRIASLAEEAERLMSERHPSEVARTIEQLERAAGEARAFIIETFG